VLIIPTRFMGVASGYGRVSERVRCYWQASLTMVTFVTVR
jgi:hypothetical protein